MKFDLHTQRYVDWKVYNVTPIKNKYGFRVKLIYADGTSTFSKRVGIHRRKQQNRRELRLSDNFMPMLTLCTKIFC